MLRYAGGKADWMAAGRAIEGTEADAVRAAALARRDVPRRGPGEQLAAAQARLTGGHWPVCVVVDEAGVVLGAVSARPLAADPRTPVAEVMRGAPETVRPSAAPEEVLEEMGGRADHVLVTTSDGQLVGLVDRADLERCVQEGRAASGGARPACAPGEEAA